MPYNPASCHHSDLPPFVIRYSVDTGGTQKKPHDQKPLDQNISLLTVARWQPFAAVPTTTETYISFRKRAPHGPLPVSYDADWNRPITNQLQDLPLPKPEETQGKAQICWKIEIYDSTNGDGWSKIEISLPSHREVFPDSLRVAPDKKNCGTCGEGMGKPFRFTRSHLFSLSPFLSPES